MSIRPVFFEGNLGRQDREKLIFVEGTDDAYFLDAVLEELDANPKTVGIVIVGGAPNFASAIASYSKSSASRKVKAVAVFRDADDNPNCAVAELVDAFKKAFKVETEHGIFNIVKNTAYGFFVLPSAVEKGDLEKMCLDTVANTHLYETAETYINIAKKTGELSQVFKRTAQVFLAGVPQDLCRGAGLGFRRGYFNSSHTSLDSMKQFLKQFLLT